MYEKGALPILWGTTTSHGKEGAVGEIPKNVIDWAERIGGYLGLDERYFDASGNEVKAGKAKFLVVGNYYGSAIYSIEGAVQRLKGFE
jgi:hypothetical protein